MRNENHLLTKNVCAVLSRNGGRDYLHLGNLIPEEYGEILADIELLKAHYNYIEDVRDCFGESAGCYKTHIPFYEIVKLSKMEPKKKGAA